MCYLLPKVVSLNYNLTIQDLILGLKIRILQLQISFQCLTISKSCFTSSFFSFTHTSTCVTHSFMFCILRSLRQCPFLMGNLCKHVNQTHSNLLYFAFVKFAIFHSVFYVSKEIYKNHRKPSAKHLHKLKTNLIIIKCPILR